MPETSARPGLAHASNDSAYRLFVGALSILALVNLLLGYVLADPALHTILDVMNGLFSLIFLVDFLYRARTAERFTHYFVRGYGWADLLSSVPFPPFKVLRLFRLVREVRLFRAAGGRATWSTLKRERANSALMSLLLLGVLVLEFGSLLMLRIEHFADGASIVTGSDALWYTIVTISTVGYGDVHPVTGLGRVLGGVIIVTGVGIFGTFTGYLANFFLSPRRGRGRGGAASDPVIEPARSHPDTSPADATARLEVLLSQSRGMVAELEGLLRDAGGQPGRSGEQPHDSAGHEQ